MRGERGAFAKRLGIAEQGLASVKDEAAGVAAEAEAALTREQQAREAAERTLADARLVAEHSAREIAQALAALAEARAALSEARGAEADAHLEAEQARDREGAAIALAQSLTSYTRHTGKTSAIADAAALGGLQRTPSTGTPMPRSSAPSSISSGKGELPKGGKGDLSVTLKTAHRAELLRVQAVHNAALEFERTERSKADKKAATAVARATRLASELDALKGGKPPVAEPSAGGSTPGSVPESRRGSKVNLLERRDSSARDPFVALSKAEARGRDLERRLADAAKARDEARSSGAGAEKEAALMKTALSLAEEQLKQLVPEFGEWRQGVIPASKQLHASHFVRMAKMQAEIAELHAERDEREKDTRRAAGEADAGPAEPVTEPVIAAAETVASTVTAPAAAPVAEPAVASATTAQPIAEPTGTVAASAAAPAAEPVAESAVASATTAQPIAEPTGTVAAPAAEPVTEPAVEPEAAVEGASGEEPSGGAPEGALPHPGDAASLQAD
ncbi:hypothetical protein T492DRAFT_901708 [Pavlovales sp. CCMP2436]|nr:hypothetical protein T492DRAFT_901708 [Pavlovales sp. CCMP2436]